VADVFLLLRAEMAKDGFGRETANRGLLSSLFVYVIRDWGDRQEGEDDIYAAMGDPFIGRALNAVHDAPTRAWTLKTLAGEAGCLGRRSP